MADLFFEDAHRFCRDFEGASARMKQPELRDAAAGFDRNMSRVAAMVELPLHLFESVSRGQMRWCQACFNVLGKPSFPTNELIDRDDPRVSPVIAEHDRLSRIQTTFEQRYRPLYVGEVALAEFAQEDVTVLSGIEAILASQAVMTWSAFEVLAGDLWIASMNARGGWLGKKLLAGVAKNKQITGGVMASHEFNIGSFIGTILAEKHYKFTGREDIADAYKDGFESVLTPPERTRLGAIFDDAGVIASVALRHLLVHRGGIVDKEFKDKVGAGGFDFAGAEAGKAVPLHGRITGGLGNVVVNRGLDLLGMADHVLGQCPL